MLGFAVTALQKQLCALQIMAFYRHFKLPMNVPDFFPIETQLKNHLFPYRI